MLAFYSYISNYFKNEKISNDYHEKNLIINTISSQSTTTSAILKPNTSSFQNLTKENILEVMNRNKYDGSCIVTISNYGFKNLTLNWIESLKRINLSKFVIFALDIDIVKLLSQKGYEDRIVLVPNNWIDFNLSSNFSYFKSKEYNKITQAKTQIVYNILKLGQNILFSDPDIVFLNKNILNHIHYLAKYSPAQIFFSQDQHSNQFHFNTGFYYAKASNYVQELFLRLINEQRKDESNAIDQFVFNKMIKSNDLNTKIAPLDHILFASGQVYFHEKINDKYNITPYMVHANYLTGETNKVNAFKSKNLWFI